MTDATNDYDGSTPLDLIAEAEIAREMEIDSALPMSIPIWVLILLKYAAQALFEILQWLLSQQKMSGFSDEWVQTQLYVASHDEDEYLKKVIHPAIEADRRRRRIAKRNSRE